MPKKKSKKSSLPDHLNSSIDKAKKTENHSEAQAGGSDRPVAVAGTTLARFTAYVEMGVQKQRPYLGQEKPPKEEINLTFELLGKKNIREIEIDGESKTVADQIYITLPKSFHEKANFYKLFQKMRYGRKDITHMAQMLGEPFVVKVVHNHKKDEEGNITKTYANIRDGDGSYLVNPPRKEDPETGESVLVKVREPLSEIKGFLFEYPAQEAWDSLFIDGEFETSDNKGGVKTHSRNWMQEKIMNAENFAGSSLEGMLMDAEEEEEDTEEDVEDDDFEEDEIPF